MKKPTISYKVNAPITSEQFIDVLKSSTLGKRRPLDDMECISGMLANSNLLISAWHCGKLVGIARSMTDFHYACYLSDLAVSLNYQHIGVGKALQKLTQQQLGPKCKLILIAAPKANSYYQALGFEQNPRCWVLAAGQQIPE
jgi:hypothetical protein